MVQKKAIKKRKLKVGVEEAVDWMKHHTIDDAKDLVCEISDEGEDVQDMVEVVQELEEMANSIHHE